MIEVRFMHPRDSSQYFTAELAPTCTGEQAIQGLLAGDEKGPFLSPPAPGRPYELVVSRTGKQITPNMTFEKAGVIDGDAIEVRQAGQGA